MCSAWDSCSYSHIDHCQEGRHTCRNIASLALTQTLHLTLILILMLLLIQNLMKAWQLLWQLLQP